jgi:hypothetical protein
MGFYRKIGLQPLGRSFQAGECSFELMTATLDELRQRVSRYLPLLEYYAPGMDWQLDGSYLPSRPSGG